MLVAPCVDARKARRVRVLNLLLGKPSTIRACSLGLSSERRRKIRQQFSKPNTDPWHPDETVFHLRRRLEKRYGWLAFYAMPASITSVSSENACYGGRRLSTQSGHSNSILLSRLPADFLFRRGIIMNVFALYMGKKKLFRVQVES